MPRKLQSSLQDYISKIKTTAPRVQLPSKNWILSGCKHPKTLSFAIDKDHHQGRQEDEGKVKDGDDAAATLSDIDKFLLENFKSLYVDDRDDDHAPGEQEEDGEEDDDVDGGVLESPRFLFDPPRRNLRGSTRFFVGSGTSSSLIEEARLSLTTSATTTTTSDDVTVGSSSSVSSPFSTSSSTAKYHTTRWKSDNDHHKDPVISDIALPEDCVAVVTYSPSPYDDFRRSMQEMVEARVRKDGKVDWEFMEELLLCYLDVNDKKSHKFVLSAFVDLAVGLRRNPSHVRVPARSQRNHHPQSVKDRRKSKRREGI